MFLLLVFILQESDGSSYEDEDDDDEEDEEEEEVEDLDESNKLLDDVDESTSLLSEPEKSVKIQIEMDDDKDDVDTHPPHSLYISETDLSEKPEDNKVSETEAKKQKLEAAKEEENKKAAENTHLSVPWTIGDADSVKSDSSFKPGLFYIGT